MRIDIENHVMDITHFLYSTEPTDGTYKDCSDTFSLSDTQTLTKRQTVTTTRAQTLGTLLRYRFRIKEDDKVKNYRCVKRLVCEYSRIRT